MSKRPDFTIAQLTEQFEVSRSTLRRGLNNRRFPNAKKDQQGRWLIPVDEVLQAGFTPRKTWLNEGVHDPTHEPGSPVPHEQAHTVQNSLEASNSAGFANQAHLEKELAHERAQVDKLKALLDAERAHVESLRMALRMIEPSVSKPLHSEPLPDVEPHQPNAETSSGRQLSFFQRMFKRR